MAGAWTGSRATGGFLKDGNEDGGKDGEDRHTHIDLHIVLPEDRVRWLIARLRLAHRVTVPFPDHKFARFLFLHTTMSVDESNGSVAVSDDEAGAGIVGVLGEIGGLIEQDALVMGGTNTLQRAPREATVHGVAQHAGSGVRECSTGAFFFFQVT